MFFKASESEIIEKIGKCDFDEITKLTIKIMLETDLDWESEWSPYIQMLPNQIAFPAFY